MLFDVREKDRKFVAFEDFRKDPKAHSLDTESGLIQLYSVSLAFRAFREPLDEYQIN